MSRNKTVFDENSLTLEMGTSDEEYIKMSLKNPMINSDTERLFSHMKFSLACTRSSQKETVTYLSAYFFLFSSLNKRSYLLK